MMPQKPSADGFMRVLASLVTIQDLLEFFVVELQERPAVHPLPVSDRRHRQDGQHSLRRLGARQLTQTCCC